MFPYAAAALAWLVSLRPDRARLREAIAVALAVAALLLGWPALVRAGSGAARSPPLGGLRLPRRRENHAVQLARDRARGRRGVAGPRRLERRRPARADRIAGAASPPRPRSICRRAAIASARAPIACRRPPPIWSSTPAASPSRRGEWTAAEPGDTVRDLEGVVDHGGGPLRLELRAEAAPADEAAPARCGSRIFVLSPIHVSATATSHDVRDDPLALARQPGRLVDRSGRSSSASPPPVAAMRPTIVPRPGRTSRRRSCSRAARPRTATRRSRSARRSICRRARRAITAWSIGTS